MNPTKQVVYIRNGKAHVVTNMLLRRGAALVPRSGQALPRGSLALRGGSRAFWGGAFENDFDEARAKARRSRLRSFLAALDSSPPEAEEQQQQLIARTLSGGSSASFESRDELATAVDAARDALASLQTASLRLELGSDASSETVKSDGATPAAPQQAVVPGIPEGALDKQMALPHRQPGAGEAAPPAIGAAAPAPPADDEADKPPDELTDEQQATLISLRASLALERLPDLWETLLREQRGDDALAGVPMQSILDTATALTSADPWVRIRLHLRLAGVAVDGATIDGAEAGGEDAAGASGASPSIEQLRAAAAASAASAFPFTQAILTGSTMLHEEEEKRLVELEQAKIGAADTIVAEIRRRTLVQRAWHTLRSQAGTAPASADGSAPSLEELASSDRSDAVLFAAMESGASLHHALVRAFLSHHDRLATRRRRRRNALKGTGLFVGLNILDFTLTNL